MNKTSTYDTLRLDFYPINVTCTYVRNEKKLKKVSGHNRILSIVQIIFYFWSFEIMEYILRLLTDCLVYIQLNLEDWLFEARAVIYCSS